MGSMQHMQLVCPLTPYLSVWIPCETLRSIAKWYFSRIAQSNHTCMWSTAVIASILCIARIHKSQTARSTIQPALSNEIGWNTIRGALSGQLRSITVVLLHYSILFGGRETEFGWGSWVESRMDGAERFCWMCCNRILYFYVYVFMCMYTYWFGRE